MALNAKELAALAPLLQKATADQLKELGFAEKKSVSPDDIQKCLDECRPILEKYQGVTFAHLNRYHRGVDVMKEYPVWEKVEGGRVMETWQWNGQRSNTKPWIHSSKDEQRKWRKQVKAAAPLTAATVDTATGMTAH